MGDIMPASILYWVLFIILAVLWAIWHWPSRSPIGTGIVLLGMLFLLGWKLFGFIVQ